MRTLNDYFLTSAIPDVSTASSTFVCVPDGGKIVKIITHNKIARAKIPLPTPMMRVIFEEG